MDEFKRWNIRLRVTDEMREKMIADIKSISGGRMSICEFTYQALEEKIQREK